MKRKELVHRLMQMVITLFGVSLLTFCLMYLYPLACRCFAGRYGHVLLGKNAGSRTSLAVPAGNLGAGRLGDHVDVADLGTVRDPVGDVSKPGY